MSEAPITHAGVVQQWQCDHMGHLNVMHYVAKFDEATWNFFALAGLTAERMRAENRGMAALEQDIRYRRELLPGDVIEIRSRLIETKEKTIRFVHEMINRKTGEVAAVCELLGICLDTATRRAAALPDGVAERARVVFS